MTLPRDPLVVNTELREALGAMAHWWDNDPYGCAFCGARTPVEWDEVSPKHDHIKHAQDCLLAKARAALALSAPLPAPERPSVEDIQAKAAAWDALVEVMENGNVHAVSMLSGFYEGADLQGPCGVIVNTNGLDSPLCRPSQRVDGDHWGATAIEAAMKARDALRRAIGGGE